MIIIKTLVNTLHIAATIEYGHEVEAYSRVAYARQRPFDVYTNDEKKLPYTFECIEVDSFFNRLFTPTVVAGSWRVDS